MFCFETVSLCSQGWPGTHGSLLRPLSEQVLQTPRASADCPRRLHHLPPRKTEELLSNCACVFLPLLSSLPLGFLLGIRHLIVRVTIHCARGFTGLRAPAAPLCQLQRTHRLSSRLSRDSLFNLFSSSSRVSDSGGRS